MKDDTKNKADITKTDDINIQETQETKDVDKAENINTEMINPDKPVINIKSFDSEAKHWGKILDAQEKATVKIKKKNENDNTPYPVSINGYVYLVKKGEKVEVPKSVAAILDEADIT